jgi:hypothetical protein
VTTVFATYFGNRRFLARLTALILAFTYFSFRTEIFSQEFEQNSIEPVAETGRCVITLPATNWESFDKDNAPKAFRIDPCLPLGVIAAVPAEVLPLAVVTEPAFILRDKSPPLAV